MKIKAKGANKLDIRAPERYAMSGQSGFLEADCSFGQLH